MRFTINGFLTNVFIFIGIGLFFGDMIVAQPPKVAVDVATVAVEAAKEDQPVLPDDFGSRIRLSDVGNSSDRARGDALHNGWQFPVCALHQAGTALARRRCAEC